MTIDTLAAFAGIVFLLAVIPGPNALLILYTSLAQGRRLAFINILGVRAGGRIQNIFTTAKVFCLLFVVGVGAVFALGYLQPHAVEGIKTNPPTQGNFWLLFCTALSVCACNVEEGPKGPPDKFVYGVCAVA